MTLANSQAPRDNNNKTMFAHWFCRFAVLAFCVCCSNENKFQQPETNDFIATTRSKRHCHCCCFSAFIVFVFVVLHVVLFALLACLPFVLSAQIQPFPAQLILFYLLFCFKLLKYCLMFFRLQFFVQSPCGIVFGC